MGSRDAKYALRIERLCVKRKGIHDDHSHDLLHTSPGLNEDAKRVATTTQFESEDLIRIDTRHSGVVTWPQHSLSNGWLVILLRLLVTAQRPNYAVEFVLPDVYKPILGVDVIASELV